MEQLIESIKRKAWASHPRGMRDSVYLDDVIDLIEEHFEQKLDKPVVSGKQPLDDVIRQAVEMAREEAPWLSTQPMYTLEQIQAACASGAVDKTVCDGNHYYSLDKSEQKDDGKCSVCGKSVCA